VTRLSKKNKKASTAIAMLEASANTVAALANGNPAVIATLKNANDIVTVTEKVDNDNAGTDKANTPMKRAHKRPIKLETSPKKQKLVPVSFRPLSRAANPPIGGAMINDNSSMVAMMAKAASGISKKSVQKPMSIMTGHLSINQKISKDAVKVFLASDKNKTSASLFRVESVIVQQSTNLKQRNAFGKFEKVNVQIGADVANHILNIETVILKRAFDVEKKMRRIDRNITYSEFCEESMGCIDGESLSLRITSNNFRTKLLCEDGTYSPMLGEYIIETSWLFDLDITMYYWNLNDRHGVAVSAHRVYIIEKDELNDTLGSFY
jgi:hypothetical protein